MIGYAWPSFEGWTPAAEAIRIRRAVYGKVHRAPTDYRWIAWSEGFENIPSFQRDLSLGEEDRPYVFTGWRSSSSGGVAVAWYPSRAFDASGRPAGLERQVLEAVATPPVPSAALALLLLPEVAALDDSVWWDSWRDPRWQSLDHHLELAPERPPALAPADLDNLIQGGIADLMACTSDEWLTRFYAELLVGTCPARLRITAESLSPLALAVLMLPLDPPVAARFAMAGGLPSRRLDARSLAQWSGVACRSDLVLEDPPVPAGARDDAAQLVATLHEGRKALLAPRNRDTVVVSPGGTFMLEFLKSSERWFVPGESAGASLRRVGPWPTVQDEREREVLRARVASFVADVDRLPAGSPEQRHLATKADLLRALLFALCPGAESLEAVALPVTGTVPALLFARRLEIEEWPALATYDRATFGALADQSLKCRSVLTHETEAWLSDCSAREGLGLLSEYARDALRGRGAIGSPAQPAARGSVPSPSR